MNVGKEQVATQPIGRRLVAAGLISVEQLQSALALQRALRRRRLGELLVELGELTAADLARHLQAPRRLGLPLGAQLVAAGAISRSALTHALRLQDRRRSLRLGELLVTLGYLPGEELRRFLEASGEQSFPPRQSAGASGTRLRTDPRT